MLHAGGEFNGTHAGIGIKGYDPVAYFTSGAALKGSESHSFEHGGVVWRFVSAHNRAAFLGDPARYAPQYGGFCAWGVAEKGRLFDVDPQSGWTIHDGRLYLNFNADLNAVFRKDAAAFTARAAGKWPALNR
jgi:hypothetical protein